MNSLKIVSTSHAHIHQYKNFRRKIHSRIANMYFNGECLWKNIIHNYAEIKIPKTSPASKHTHKKKHTLRMKYEIQFLYAKKC
jgi:hypothetical protein